MLESFCAASNLKAFLQRERDMPESAISQCASQLDKISQPFSPDKNFLEATAEHSGHASRRKKMAEPLQPDIQAALLANKSLWESRIDGWTTPTRAIRYRRISARGLEFTTYTESQSLGSIFFKPDDTQVMTPGRIQDIFAVETLGHDGLTQEDILCAIKRYSGEPLPIPCIPGMTDIIAEFGAHIWHDDLSDQLDIIPITAALYHSIGRPWSDGLVVLKMMKRVSNCNKL